MGMRMYMGDEGSRASSNVGCILDIRRPVRGLSPAHSHEGAGGGFSEDPTGNIGFVYPATNVGGGALGYYAHAY
jgi:hypothetical protein